MINESAILIIFESNSPKELSAELGVKEYEVNLVLAEKLLHERDCILRINRKMNEGKSHAFRNLRFERINSMAMEFMKEKQSVISFDTKKGSHRQLQ